MFVFFFFFKFSGADWWQRPANWVRLGVPFDFEGCQLCSAYLAVWLFTCLPCFNRDTRESKRMVKQPSKLLTLLWFSCFVLALCLIFLRLLFETIETETRDRRPFGRIRSGLPALCLLEPKTWPAAGEPLSPPAASHPRVDIPPGGLG